MRHIIVVGITVALLCSGAPGIAQTDIDTSKRVDATVRLGRAMVLAPLCDLRNGSWAADLRSAATEAATSPGGIYGIAAGPALTRQIAASALGYAESEALEDYAGAQGPRTCKPLAASPDLSMADRVVKEWRARHAAPAW